MADEWVNTNTARNPKLVHIHEDGSRHETDKGIPMLSVDGIRPRYYKHSFVCKDCAEVHEEQVSV